VIPLELDKEKVITIATVPYIPNRAIMEMAQLAGPGDYDKIKVLPQLQILRAGTLSVIEGVIMTPAELSQLFHLAQAVGRSLGDQAIAMDQHWDRYRKMVVGKKEP
jgi:hypothetical protein